ncbi:hypothetical protein HPP92_021898 [Vanilla planifolia]|uniref:Uncharacterized protein n=1 Tax=Vanilla planifolia TaxID=51239 RepID=A0A835PW84_VANPL|nr:hypothetical protein HPP92_021898 [Vanilla planifolia]
MSKAQYFSVSDVFLFNGKAVVSNIRDIYIELVAWDSPFLESCDVEKLKVWVMGVIMPF